MQAPPDQTCSIVDCQFLEDPEDGTTDEADMLLTERKSGLKVDSWETLWKVLFPNDTHISSPEFVNPMVVEVFEVINAVEGFHPEHILQLDTNAHAAAPGEQPYHISQLLTRLVTHLKTELKCACDGCCATPNCGSLGLVPEFGAQGVSDGDVYQRNHQGNIYNAYD
ncbi:hypothetical protein JX266_013999 [Neoarthrinium moseri]|nr:hypothetical protein JX266_013999 [Neoarthrinium moseri]